LVMRLLCLLMAADALLGSILLCGIAIAASAYLLWRSERKEAAVGRRYA
jgi:hypothetical protein